MTQKLPDVIAIDGPAASGKTTIGYLLAQRLGYVFLDTGCMYRATTRAAQDKAILMADEEAVTALSRQISIIIVPSELDDGRQYSVILDGVDVTWEIRSEAVTADVSLVSSYPGVRQEMVRRQRELAAGGRVVMVGRDIGTVVLPDAQLKLYLVATAEERASRRWLELRQRGSQRTYQDVLADVERRDRIDSNRAHSPLRPAEDAILLETTGLGPEEVLELIINHVFGRRLITANQQPASS